MCEREREACGIRELLAMMKSFERPLYLSVNFKIGTHTELFLSIIGRSEQYPFIGYEAVSQKSTVPMDKSAIAR